MNVKCGRGKFACNSLTWATLQKYFLFIFPPHSLHHLSCFCAPLELKHTKKSTFKHDKTLKNLRSSPATCECDSCEIRQHFLRLKHVFGIASFVIHGFTWSIKILATKEEEKWNEDDDEVRNRVNCEKKGCGIMFDILNIDLFSMSCVLDFLLLAEFAFRGSVGYSLSAMWLTHVTQEEDEHDVTLVLGRPLSPSFYFFFENSAWPRVKTARHCEIYFLSRSLMLVFFLLCSFCLNSLVF